MREFSYTLTDENGLHARPAGLLVKAASGFESKITINTASKSADGKKIFAVMQLGAKCSDTITVKIEGADEDAALERLEEFFKENL